MLAKIVTIYTVCNKLQDCCSKTN